MKAWQMHMRPDVKDKLVKIVHRNPYCMLKGIAKFFNYSMNTVLRRLTALGYENKWPTWML